MAAGCDPCRQPLGGGPGCPLMSSFRLLEAQSSFFLRSGVFVLLPQSTHVEENRTSNRPPTSAAAKVSCHVTFSPFYVLITSSNARFELLVPFKKYPSPHHFCITKQDILPCPSASPTIPTRPPKPSRIRSWKHVTVSSDPRYTHLMLIVCHWHHHIRVAHHSGISSLTMIPPAHLFRK